MIFRIGTTSRRYNQQSLLFIGANLFYSSLKQKFIEFGLPRGDSLILIWSKYYRFFIGNHPCKATHFMIMASKTTLSFYRNVKWISICGPHTSGN